MADQPQNENTPGWSRYQRVKQILNDAAGEACPSYQGHERFWNLPLRDFLAARLYGIALIAPAPAAARPASLPIVSGGSCCHTEPAAPKPAKFPGRGAASGLIRGLRGQFPFDGTQFPPLPWGGTRVDDQDIQFIEKWIDDGCPENDAPSQAEVSQSLKMALAQGHEAHPLHRGAASNQFRDETGKPKIRQNIEFLSTEELQRFRNAIARMKSFDNYYQDERSFGYWGRIHGSFCQHAWEEFLTWHRAYLHLFEQQLQDIDPTVTLPYWDWSMPLYRDNLAKSLEDMGSDKPIDNGIVPEAYRCWIDENGLEELRKGGIVPEADLNGLQIIVNQKFDSGSRLFKGAGIDYGKNQSSDMAIRNLLDKINPLWHYQRWPGGSKLIIFEGYPTSDDVQHILDLDNFFSFASGPADNHFFGALENIHNLIHNFSGGINPHYVKGTPPIGGDEPYTGDMVNAGVTAFDPIFWGHHSNVDRLWAEWQKRHPGGGPDNPNSVLVPWNMTVSETASTDSLGYTYMQSSHLFRTDTTIPITRFRSAAAEVHPVVAATHRRAEVDLHRVRYVTRAGFHIRVFINEPDATAETPTRGNDHFVGQLNMFTGLCIGGPGHCDPPPEQQRKFDHRKRPHKTPGNFRIDATNTVRKLRDGGASDFAVNLVVLNTDGTAATDALHLDAVSLNFFD